MWQHEILRDLSLYKKASWMQFHDKLSDASYWGLLESIKDSQTFFFGEYNEVKNMEKNYVGKPVGFEHVPYMQTMFEYTWNLGDDPDARQEGRILVSKRAMLIMEFPQKLKDTMHSKNDKIKKAMEQTFGDNTFSEGAYDMDYRFFPIWYLDDEKRWVPSPISIGMYKDCPGKIQPVSVAPRSLCEKILGDDILKDISEDIAASRIFLDILNTKNIVTKNVIPPEKLNRKRIRNGKEPLREYKILEVVRGCTVQKNAGNVDWFYKPSSTTAFHMCRGHFKTYTEDAPLFGKYTGTFWWQPQARGSKENGEIVKDYVVKQA